MKVCFDKKLIGSEQHLIVDYSTHDKTYILSSTIDDDCYHYDGNVKQTSVKCFDTLLKLNLIDVKSLFVENPYVKAINLLTKNHKDYAIKWQYVMPKTTYTAFLRNIVNNVGDLLSLISPKYYDECFVPGNFILQNLKRCCVDVNKIYKYISDENSDSNIHALNTFKPTDGVQSELVIYDRLHTRTGRLTVDRGPMILTVKRDYRDILKSRYKDGVICYVDFRALEARVLLSLANKIVDNPDVYGMLSKTIFKSEFTRNTVKKVVLQKLYGSSDQTLSRQLDVSSEKLKWFLSTLMKYFDVQNILNMLKQERQKFGFITNFYGRKIPIEEVSTGNHVLLNYYVQSTAVDVALLGFSELLKQVRSEKLIVDPIFVLHDALILDVHPDYISKVKELTSESLTISGMCNKFYCSWSEI